ncbi:MAG: acyl carrier protein [Aeromicrobium sp.]
MPPSDEVRDQLTDILVQVVGCAPKDVVDHAELKQLGVDSLAVVEMADELGRRFDIYLSDESVNAMRTVGDAVKAVVRHDGTRANRSTTYQAPPPNTDPVPGAAPVTSAPPPVEVDPEKRNSALKRLAFWFAATGAAVGIVFGLSFSGLIGAMGINSSTLPPLTLPTTPAPTTATPTPTPTASPDAEETPDPDPTLTIPQTEVGPGERFTLEGAFPALGGGERLQVQVKDPGEQWDEFPVTATTRDGGRYRTQIYTSRTGKRDFRMAHEDSNTQTPAISVTIG